MLIYMKRFFELSLSALILGSFFSCRAQTKAREGLQTDLALPYLVRTPQTPYKNPPILFLMHGYGSNETDLFELRNAIPDSFVLISVRAPLTLANGAYQWFRNITVHDSVTGSPEDLKNSVDKMVAEIQGAVKEYKANPKAVYISGFSQGGIMSYEIGLQYPQLVKGFAPLSGKIFASLKPLIKKDAALQQLRIFIGHGDADNRIDYQYAKDAQAYLQNLGLQPEFHTYKGMQDSISQEELQDFVNWLTK